MRRSPSVCDKSPTLIKILMLSITPCVSSNGVGTSTSFSCPVTIKEDSLIGVVTLTGIGIKSILLPVKEKLERIIEDVIFTGKKTSEIVVPNNENDENDTGFVEKVPSKFVGTIV